MVQGVDLVAQQMNTVINDYGDITLAVGAEGSLARFKCLYPKMIKELLAEMAPKWDREFNHKRRDREFNHKRHVEALAEQLFISHDLTPEEAFENAEKFIMFMENNLCPLKKSSPPSSW